MLPVKRYQVRGIPGEVNRVSFDGRVVDYWAPPGGSDRLLIAHDGQNIFDRRTATFVYTWRLGQNALRTARESRLTPPAIIAIFHSSSKTDPNGRAKDLCPEDPFRDGVEPLTKPSITLDELRGNNYLTQIFDEIVPAISNKSGISATAETTAMIGSSMGGLSTLYAMTKFSNRFHTALALSPHWVLAGDPLVDWILPRLPNNESIKIWMSRGTKGLDASYPPFQDRADQLMRSLKWGNRYSTKVYDRSSHNERSWAGYVAEPLRFWLNS